MGKRRARSASFFGVLTWHAVSCCGGDRVSAGEYPRSCDCSIFDRVAQSKNKMIGTAGIANCGDTSMKSSLGIADGEQQTRFVAHVPVWLAVYPGVQGEMGMRINEPRQKSNISQINQLC